MNKFTYIFTGTVYPLRVDFTLKGLPEFEIQFPDWNINGNVKLEIVDCAVTITYATQQQFTGKTEPNIETLKNLIERSARNFVDAYCFAHSYNYDLDLESVTCEEDNYKYTFSVQGEWNILGEDQTFLKSIKVILNTDDHVLGITLSDFRRAIKYPDMTAMFCFRSLETIRREYFDDASIKDDNKRNKSGWIKMSKTLEVTDGSIYDQMRDIATDNRHGLFPAITYDQRERMMNYSRSVISKFIEWKLANI